MTGTKTTKRRTPWLRTHTDLSGHRKTIHLADLLDISPVHAVGHLVVFWHNVLTHEDGGDLSRCRPRHIAHWADWSGDPVRFVEALVDAGWLDRDGDQIRVHDWDDYAGPLLKERARSEQRRKSDRVETAAEPRLDRGGTAARPRPESKSKSKSKSKSTDVPSSSEEGGATRPDSPPKPPKRPSELLEAAKRFIDEYPDRSNFACSDTTIKTKFYALVEEGIHTVDGLFWLLGEWKKSEEWQNGYVSAPDKFLAKSNQKFRKPPPPPPVRGGGSTRPRSPLESCLDYASFEGLKDNV